MLKRNKKWLKVIRISKNDSIFATEKLRQEAARFGRPEGFGIDLADG